MRLVTALLLALTACITFAQGRPPVNQEVIDAMKEVGFIAGEWEGAGWFMAEGKKLTTNVLEKISYKAGKTVLILEGLGKDDKGSVVHNAFGVLYYDGKTKEYRMRSFLEQGTTGEFKATAKDGVIVWSIPSSRTIRYTIKLNAAGHWHEIGEVDMGEGKWFQFMEMTLKKIKD